VIGDPLLGALPRADREAVGLEVEVADVERRNFGASHPGLGEGPKPREGYSSLQLGIGEPAW
jgi:hypothetical protein